MDTAVSVELFVEILNRYVYYFDQGNEQVSSFAPAPSTGFRSPHQKPSQLSCLPVTNIQPGHNKIPQRPHRIDTQQSIDISRRSKQQHSTSAEYGESKETLL